MLCSQATNTVKVVLDAGELLEISLHEILGFGKRQVRITRQTKSAHPIDQAEIDTLGVPALVFGYIFQRDTENSGSRRRMNILSGLEGL